jgi:4-hydroxy-tetrahydrodipicolinate reductase
MKIALIGYGRMGREVESVALDAGHQIVGRFDIDAPPTIEGLRPADVCIEFSVPEAAMDNMKLAADAGVDIVVGTTGWYDRLEEVRGWFGRSALVYAQNFSIGVNVFYRVVRNAARTMNPVPGYDVWVEERHHRQKVDSPSGTALRIGQILIEELDRKTRTVEGSPEGRIAPDALQIASVRAGHIAGVHTVGFDSEADYIELTHVARSRRGFAEGALAAARWVRGRKGVFTMDDVEFETD